MCENDFYSDLFADQVFLLSQVASRERASFFANRRFTFLCFRMFIMEIMCACGMLSQAHALTIRRHAARKFHALHVNMHTTTETTSEKNNKSDKELLARCNCTFYARNFADRNTAISMQL